MSYRKTKTSRNPNVQQLIGAAGAILINVILCLMVNALFTIDLGTSGGRVLT